MYARVFQTKSNHQRIQVPCACQSVRMCGRESGELLGPFAVLRVLSFPSSAVSFSSFCGCLPCSWALGGCCTYPSMFV